MMREYSYTIRTVRRAKSLRITIRRDLSVLVTKPSYVSKKSAIDFLISRESWIMQKREEIVRSGNPDLLDYSKEHFERFKEKALELLSKKVSEWNEFFCFEIRNVNVKRMMTRWGSCSSSGALHFNYKLIFLPDHLIDYVIVHELCHLKEFNHSKDFWKLVEEKIPDYVQRKKELRETY